MSTQQTRALIAKLNDLCRNALEGAIGLCMARTHHTVELEHYLLKLCEAQDDDLVRILRNFQVDMARLTRDLHQTLDRWQSGNTRAPTLSRRIPILLREAWLCSSVDFNAPRVRSSHLLLAMLRHDELSQIVLASSAELRKVPVEALQQKLPEITANSAEAPGLAAQSDRAEGEPDLAATGTQKLDQYTVDLTDRAKKGALDPVLERTSEIQQVIDVLTRRRQNNPILVGEAGVGKTAVVEGLALRIVAGDAPTPLRGVSLRILDLGLLQAGAGVRGEFEARLKAVIDEVKASVRPIILFIDEAHTLIGAGGAAGQGDAANMLKPALARGELRTIAATTWNEYKAYFEKDKALARRFQLVKVPEPSVDQAIIMVRGLAHNFASHHDVNVLDEAVEAAVRLSHRYIADRHLPDKAVGVLGTACARVALSQGATPPAIDNSRQRIAALNSEQEALQRETRVGSDFAERLAHLQRVRVTESERLAALEARWEREKALSAELHELTARTGTELSPAELAETQTKLAERRRALVELQAQQPLVQPWVDSQTIAEVISGWTGVPVGKMVKDDIEAVLRLPEFLRRRVVGQDHALEAIGQRIRTSRAGLEDRRRPIGVFLLVGPSGVGKTETALALAESLFGGEHNMVTLNMSEYQEEYRVSSLTGPPRGYEGSSEGGVLTEAVRRRPYTVVLLDEVEKAHTDVIEVFYQVFDRGILTDATGIEVDFKNTVILMTSNVGSATIMSLTADEETRPGPQALAEALRPDLRKVFQDAFLGRTTVVPYYPIKDEVLRSIIRMQLGRIGERLRQNHRADLRYDEVVVNTIATRCTEVESGARNVDHILTRSLLPELSRELLLRMAAGQKVTSVQVKVGTNGNFEYRIS